MHIVRLYTDKLTNTHTSHLTSVRQSPNHSARIYTHRCRDSSNGHKQFSVCHTFVECCAYERTENNGSLTQHQIEQRPITKQNIFSFYERRPINLFWHFDGNLFSLRTQYRHHFEQQQQQRRRRRIA